MPIGVLLQVVDAFGQVFQSLAIAMNDWAAVNEFRSVCRRLVEFEAMLVDGGGVLQQHPGAVEELLTEDRLYHAVVDDDHL